MRLSTAIVALAIVATMACKKHSASAENGSTTATEAPKGPASLTAAKPSPMPIVVTIAIGGDLLPHTNVLKNKAMDVFAKVGATWADADVRIANLEAPVGDASKADRVHLVYTSPPSWFDELVDGAKVNAFAAANNHACDLGLDGLVATTRQANARKVPIAGIATNDPWVPAKIATPSGKVICLVSWTSVLNETAGSRFEACMKGNAEARLAFAPANEQGVVRVHEALSAPDRWDGCDARIAYFHGGVEYHGQVKQVLALAEAAAAYVDVVAIAHPHVPDGASVVKAPAPKAGANVGDRAVGRGVPIFRSLGNLVSNQGYAWSAGGPTGVVTSDDGTVDMLRTVWTAIAMIARVEFTWASDAAPGNAPSNVRYGFALAFLQHSGAGYETMRLRAIGSTSEDALASALDGAPIPWSWLIRDRCRVVDSSTRWCESH